ncbi:MAG: FAD-binding oxidoreductase, partial [Candidatus Tectomicrobia bacterium]|nr:FAD-binding oxidoreductase [Candidatus Tectomicrobia bacterium]
YVQDGVIPRSKLPEVLSKISQLSEKYHLRVANVFHAGDGNLHPLILFDERNEEELKNVPLISQEILKVCVDVGGALSGEHGIGLEKIDAMSLVFTDDDLDVMLKVRTALNPKNLCNPGKIFPTPGRCVELRPTSTQLHPTLERW